MNQIIQTSFTIFNECVELLRTVAIIILAGTVICSPVVLLVVAGLLMFAD